MAEEKKKTKGFLSSLWKVVTSPWVTIPLGLAIGLFIMPPLADMGTWLKAFHDTENIRALAFQNTMHPLTGWIPYHAGLTMEPGGLFYDIMTWFIQPELDVLTAQADAAKFATNQAAAAATGAVAPTLPPSGLEGSCEFLQTCEGPPIS